MLTSVSHNLISISNFTATLITNNFKNKLDENRQFLEQLESLIKQNGGRFYSFGL